jgi:Cdc6-like AAA superfamily ATPase
MNDKCRVKHDLARHEEDIEVLQLAQEVTQAEHDEQVRDGVIQLLRTDADIVMQAINNIDENEFGVIRAAIGHSILKEDESDLCHHIIGESLVAIVTAHLTDHVENTI